MEDKDKWIEDVFNSMEGSSRARPNSDLFERIEGQLNAPEAKFVPLRQWGLTAAAAILVLVINLFALRQFTQSNEFNTSEMVVSGASSQELISNYKIYE